MNDRQKKPEELEEEASENQNNIITSLAERAMSVAGPVVPTKKDGGVDQERSEHTYYQYTSTPLVFVFANNLTQLPSMNRLVAMLADLGQKGGLLRLVGKFALLWGGIRGAISLTDKLISFSHIAERPLFQR